jgi:hypothetical protein
VPAVFGSATLTMEFFLIQVVTVSSPAMSSDALLGASEAARKNIDDLSKTAKKHANSSQALSAT